MELSEIKRKIAYLDEHQARSLIYAMVELNEGKKAFETCWTYTMM